MKAVVKLNAGVGAEYMDVPEPKLKPGYVLARVKYGSVCGTDLHIFYWDDWAKEHIHPPRIIGHEFSGVIEQVGEGVTSLKPGDEFASESHITCGTCKQCLLGQRHVCVNTRILGVDADGGFATYAVIPEANARKVPTGIPLDLACIQDPLGNAVHTVFAGPVEGQDILITGAGPIGLFAIAVCKAGGAKRVAVTEISPYRIGLAKKMGADVVVNPTECKTEQILNAEFPDGFDGVLEMSGHPNALDLAVKIVRPGGRISLLGIFHDSSVPVRLNDAIHKGVDIQCIIGRRLWETWEQMEKLLLRPDFDLSPVITHRFHISEFHQAMEMIKHGETGKVVFEIS